MALQSAQLLNAITANQITFSLVTVPSNVPAVGATPMSVGLPTLIDAEFMAIIAQPATGIVSVRRGVDGTAAVAHDILSNVYVGFTGADLPTPQAGTTTTTDFAEDTAISLGQDQTIALLGSNAIYNINKATAAAIVLPAPSLVDNAVVYTFTSNTAAAHVITATGLIQDGTTTVKSTMTFAAAKGASIMLAVENGFYNVVGSPQNVTLS